VTRLIAPMLAAVALAGCASNSEPMPAEGGCNVTVVFGSYAMGIDSETFQQVDAWVERRTDLVPHTTTSTWGREGEKTMCLTTLSPAATRQVYAAIEKMIPRTSRRGPVEVKDDTGRSFQSKMPAEMAR